MNPVLRRSLGLLLAALALGLLGLFAGSSGWAWPGGGDAVQAQIVWDIRLPRGLGAWLVGALLGLAGALAQGLFRNPLADPYLLGSASGASLGVGVWISWIGGHALAGGAWARLGMTGAAFVGALLAVLLTLLLARGVQQTMRLLLAGVVVGVVLGALTSMLALLRPELLLSMQGFVLGSAAFLGWQACALLAAMLLITLLGALVMARVLDALALGEATAQSLGVPLAAARLALVSLLALATAAAVAQAGLIAFVGLAAPHLVRSRGPQRHAGLLWLSALTGGLLLLAADTLARLVWAPQDVPVGVCTAVLGGAYLLWRMQAMNRGAT